MHTIDLIFWFLIIAVALYIVSIIVDFITVAIASYAAYGWKGPIGVFFFALFKLILWTGVIIVLLWLLGIF